MSVLNVTYQNEKFEFKFTDSTTVKQLKEHVEKNYKLPTQGQNVRSEDLNLIPSGDDQTLASLSFKDGSKIFVEQNVIAKYNLYRFPYPKGFPSNVDSLKLEKKYSGYSAPEQVIEPDTGVSYILKRGATTKREHLINEFITTEAYSAAGLEFISISRPYLNRSHDVVLLAKFIPKSVSWNSFITESSTTVELKEKVRTEIKKNFVLDCIFGSWDVIGYENDHIVVDENNTPWRINSANCLSWRTTGAIKKASEWGSVVQEFFTMTQEDVNENCGKVFYDITFQEIKSQISQVLKKEKEILAVFEGKDKEIISERLRYASLFAQQEKKEPVALETFWAKQLQLMSEKGFKEEKKNIEILSEVGGNVEAAFEYIKKIFYQDE